MGTITDSILLRDAARRQVRRAGHQKQNETAPTEQNPHDERLPDRRKRSHRDAATSTVYFLYTVFYSKSFLRDVPQHRAPIGTPSVASCSRRRLHRHCRHHPHPQGKAVPVVGTTGSQVAVASPAGHASFRTIGDDALFPPPILLI